MEKSEAIKLAVDLVKSLIEKGQINVISSSKGGSEKLLGTLKVLTEGIIEIDKNSNPPDTA